MNWRDEYKDLEQAHMLLLDQYAELAAAIGVPLSIYFQVPLWSHSQIVEKARQVSVSLQKPENSATEATHQGSSVHQSPPLGAT